MNKPIYLTRTGWWAELGNTGLSPRLVDMLRGLIGATLSDSIPPEASQSLIMLASGHLKSGLFIGDDFYNVMLDIPADQERYMTKFRLYRTLPGNKLLNL